MPDDRPPSATFTEPQINRQPRIRYVTHPSTHESWMVEERDAGDVEVPLAASPEVTQPRIRILVIDDSAADRYAAKRTLERVIGDVFEADGVITGIEMALVIRPDLILLDYRLPGVEGAAAIRLFKADPQLASIPVLLFTGFAEGVNDEARAYARGVIDKREFSADTAVPLIAAAIGA